MSWVLGSRGYLTIGIWMWSLLIPVFLKGESPEKVSSSRFDMAEVLQQHLGDRYDWPLLGIHAPAVTLPLPVILYTPTQGVQLFSSSRLKEDLPYKGFYLASDGRYAGKVVYRDSAGQEVRPLDFSFTRNAAALFVAALILLTLLGSLAFFYRRYPLRMPSHLRGALEMLATMLIEEVLRPCLGKYTQKYTPYLLSLFFFILTLNLLGLTVVFPGGVNLSGNPSVCLVLAASTLVLTLFAATRTYWKEIFWPNVPIWLNTPIPMLTFIELVGIFTKPMALMVRMFANLLGGHIITLVLASLVFLFVPMGLFVAGGTSIFVYVFSIFMLLIEVLVCVIQAYVFFMLSALFIGLTKVETY